MHPCLAVFAQIRGEPKFDKSASNGAICLLVRSCSYNIFIYLACDVRQVDKEHRPTGLHDFLPSMTALEWKPSLFDG